MALLTNGGASMTMPTATQLLGLNGTTNSNDSNNDVGNVEDFFLSNLISALPACWDNPTASITKPMMNNGLSKSPPG